MTEQTSVHLAADVTSAPCGDTGRTASALADAVGELLYLVDELSGDGHIDYSDECNYFEIEQFCGRYCQSCGCIKAKVDAARAALAAATKETTA